MKEFKYDENRRCKEVLDYIEGLSISGNPFKCLYLRVLPEDMKIRKHESQPGKSDKYHEGDLVCVERLRYEVSSRCGGLSKLRINKDGNLECACDWPLEGKVVLNLKK